MDSFSEAVQWRRRCGPSRTSIFGEGPVIAPTLLLSLSEVGDRVRSIRGLLHLSLSSAAGESSVDLMVVRKRHNGSPPAPFLRRDSTTGQHRSQMLLVALSLCS